MHIPIVSNCTMEYPQLESILFLDIETVSGKSSFQELPETMQNLWEIKAGQLQRDGEWEDDVLSVGEVSYTKRAAIYAEFGKIVCISVGYLSRTRDNPYEWEFRIKSFAEADEALLLTQFAKLLDNPKFQNLCGHNIKEFDIPYICRRMLIQSVPIPKLIDVGNKKPWEIPFLDTLAMWKFGDYKAYTSLNLLTTIFDIPSPKDDMDGSDVHRVFYEENDLPRIATYCEKDVIATAQLYLRLKLMPLIKDENIIRK